MSNPEGDLVNSGNMVFQIVPFMLFNSRKRVELQIDRIQKFTMQKISSRRIDDQDSIKKNIANLKSEIESNIQKVKNASKQTVKYGEKVMLVHFSSGLFLRVEARQKERLSVNDLAQSFKPFKLTVTHYPDSQCLFEFVPVYKHKLGHSIKLDQPCRLGYVHERPVEKDYVLDSEYGHQEAIMFSQEPCGSLRLSQPLPVLKKQLPLSIRSYHGSTVLIFNKESQRYLTLTVKTNQERIFQRFKDIKKKVMEKQLKELTQLHSGLAHGLDLMLEFKNISQKGSHLRRKSRIQLYRDITEKLTYRGGNNYNMTFAKQNEGIFRASTLLWQVVFDDNGYQNKEDTYIVKVWLKHIMYNTVIGPLLMHVSEETAKSNITVKFQTVGLAGKYINIDGEFSQKTEQFQFTKLVSLKSYSGKKTPTQQMTIIKAESEDIKIALFLSSVNNKLEKVRALDDDWDHDIVEMLEKLIMQIQSFILNERVDLIDRRVPYNTISTLHQDIVRDAHVIKNILDLFEHMNRRMVGAELPKELNIQQEEDDLTSQGEYVLNGMLRQIIELLRVFIKNNQENIRITIIYFIPRLILRHHFKMFPVLILRIIQQVLGHITIELFQTVEKSILLFLRNLVSIATVEDNVYNNMNKKARIELFITLKTYARMLNLNHNEDIIKSYFYSFIMEDLNFECIMQKFHTFYTGPEDQVDQAQSTLTSAMTEINCPRLIQEQLYCYTEIYNVFLTDEMPKRARIANLVRDLQREKGSFIDPYMPVLSGLLRIIRHTFEEYHSFIMYQPALLRIESDFGVVQRQNQISSQQIVHDLHRMSDFETILRFDSFDLFKCLRRSVHSYILKIRERKHQSFFRDIQDNMPDPTSSITNYHIEVMRMYNSILLQPGVLSEKRRMQFLGDTLAGYLEVCYEWVNVMRQGHLNPYEQKILFPRISSLELQILRMQVETQFTELKNANKDMRFLTSGMESVRNYLNQIEICYESQTAKRNMKFEESNLKQLRRTLTRKEGEETFREAATGRSSSRQRESMKLYQEAWDQVVNFLSIVLDIDEDVFLDAYVSQSRGVQKESDIEAFINGNICKLLESPRDEFSLINKYDRLAVIVEALLSWLPFINDMLVLRKTLSFITRITNLKIELRNLMCNSTFLSYKSLQPQSLNQIQQVEEHLLEVDKLINSTVSHWRHFLRETIEGIGEGSIKQRSTIRVHSQDLAKYQVMERLISLLEKIDGFFSLFLPFKTHCKADICAIGKDSINQEDLNLASKIFRVIHGHQVIIRLTVTMHDLLSQALQCYSPNTLYIQKDAEQAKRVAATVPKVFSWAYRILSKFTKYNIENKEIMIHHASNLLPAYGAMFQVALFYSEHHELSLFHQAFVDMFISIFSMNERLVYYPIIVQDFMVKLNLRIVFEKFSVMSKIYAEILQNSSDPMLFDLAVNQLKVIKKNIDETSKVQKRRHVKNRKVVLTQTLKWPELRECLHKMKTNLQSEAFKTIRMKIQDFYLVLKSDIVMGITGRDISKMETSRDLSSFALRQFHTPSKIPLLNVKGRISAEHDAQSSSEEDLSLIQPNRELEYHQSLEQKLSQMIKINPELEAVIRSEKSLMHHIIFKEYRKSQHRCGSCSKKKRDKIALLQFHKRSLSRFFKLRNNRPQILQAKLLFYIEHLIKILKVDHIFEVADAESVRLQLLEIYFIYKQSNQVAKILEARVIEMISYFFTNKNSVTLMNILPLLLEFANYMLNQGSSNVQNRFYEFFNQLRDINVFSHINSLIRRQIYSIETQKSLLLMNARFSKTRESKKLVLKDPANESMFFLKSLCENHHVAFQHFMTDQGYEKNYDMIDLSVDFLYSLINLIFKTYYDSEKIKLTTQIKHILELIRNSKLSSTSHFMLNYPGAQDSEAMPMAQFRTLSKQKKSQKRRMAKLIEQNFNRDVTQIPNLQLVCDNIITSLNAIIEYVQGPCLENQKRIMISSFMRCAEKIFREFHFTFSEDSLMKVEIKNLQILLMKSNCALILRSMVEGRGQDDYLAKAIKTEITIRDVEYLIAYTYYAFLRLNNGVFILDEQYFGKPGTPNWYTLEAGFNFYFLMRSFFDSQQNLEKAQLDRVYTLIEMEDRRRAEKGVCREIYEFFRDIFNCKKQSFVYQNFLPPLEMLSKHRFLRYYNTYFKDAIEFYKRNSASIQIHQNGRLETVYFPRAPSYNTIPRNQKESLIFNLSTDTDSVKVDSIMKKGTYLIESMSRRFYFQNFFLKWPLLGLFFARSELWNIFAFWFGLIINIIIFFSFTTTNSPNPRHSGNASFLITLVGDAPGEQALGPASVVEPATDWILDVLGASTCFFILFGNLLLIFQKFSMHIQESKRKKYNVCLTCQRRHQSCLGCLKFLSIVWGCMTDYIFLYTIAYLVFAFLGLFEDYVFYAFLLTAIFRRSPELQNILKAIWRPRKELLYTLIIFLLAQYVFALIIFEYYQPQVANRHCISLTTCFFTVIDQTFKNDGGIGGYLDGNITLQALNQSADYPGRRLILHQAFNFIMLILITQVFAAILIDTFGDMRNEKNKIEELVNSTCLICGKERDEIERDGEDFTKHVKVRVSDGQFRHNMFNYILFIAYLKKKNPIDYTGIESYVYQSYNSQRLDWFPIYKVSCIQPQYKNMK